MNMIRSAIAGILALSAVASASAQQFPTVPDHTVIGRIGVVGQSGPSQAIPFANFLPIISGAQSVNTVFAGPASGISNTPSFRALVGADLPAPGASSKGGVQSLTCSASNWFNTLSTGGVFGCTQPNFTDLAGSISAGQIPAGVIVNAAVSNSAAIAGSKITTVTTSVAGVVPALPNDGTKFFNGLGAYTAPPSAGQMILLNTLTASASATLSDTTSLTSTYSVYEIVFENILPATTATNCEIQVHSGGTFPATSYLTTGLGNTAGGALLTSVPTTFIPCSISNLVTSNAAPGVSGRIRVHTPSTSAIHMWTGEFGHLNSGGGVAALNTAGYWNSAAVVDGFQVLFSSGNITSGVIKIYGIQ